MSTPAFTRQQVEDAGDLDFATPPRAARPAQDLTITVRCRVDSFDTEICFQGDVEKLHAIVARLRSLGAEPVSAAPIGQAMVKVTTPAPATNGKPKVERVEPVYKPDGTPCCPTHMKPLQEGRYGLFCPSRAKGDEPANDKGYCNLKFSE